MWTRTTGHRADAPYSRRTSIERRTHDEEEGGGQHDDVEEGAEVTRRKAGPKDEG
jgi:hypothetical protein